MTNSSLFDDALAWLAANVPSALDRFDARTGRFMTGTGWAVTNQDVMLTLAYLYLTRHPGNPLYRDARLLEIIGRAGDAVRDFQYPDGTVEFVKVDGSRWGPIFMPWTMYHWLETYALLRDTLDVERLRRWEAGLRLAFAGIARELRERMDRGGESVVHNIPCWNAMSLHRAAGVLGEPDWRSVADRMVRLTVDAQHPDGYWPEFEGPTVSYNLVYVHALGLYHLQGGDVEVLPALDRARQFHEVFTYPDGTLVETVDGRVKYHHRVGPSGLVGFAVLPEGRRFVAALVRRAIERRAGWVEPHFAQFLRYWAGDPPLASAPSPFEQDQVETVRADALVVKERGWYACLSGFTHPPVESRWGQDRQSFLGIWHQATGLIVGGGNSKDQPEWSTFEVLASDGERCYVPERGAVAAGERAVELVCGGRTLRAQVAAVTPDRLTLRFAAQGEPGDRLLVHLPLQLHAGEALRASFGGEARVSEAALAWEAGPGPHQLGHGGWRLHLDGPCQLAWPSFPFNPYAKDGRSNAGDPAGKLDLASAVAILTLPLERGERRDVQIAVAAVRP